MHHIVTLFCAAILLMEQIENLRDLGLPPLFLELEGCPKKFFSPWKWDGLGANQRLPELNSPEWKFVARFLCSKSAQWGDMTKFAAYFRAKDHSAVSKALTKWKTQRQTSGMDCTGTGSSQGTFSFQVSLSSSLPFLC